MPSTEASQADAEEDAGRAREIQDRTLLPQQTVSRKLRQLPDSGLAEKSAGGWARGTAEPKHAASEKVQGRYERDTARAERERAAYQNNKLRKVQAARRKELRQRKAEVRRIVRVERRPNYGYLGFFPLDEHRLVDGVTGESSRCRRSRSGLSRDGPGVQLSPAPLRSYIART